MVPPPTQSLSWMSQGSLPLFYSCLFPRFSQVRFLPFLSPSWLLHMCPANELTLYWFSPPPSNLWEGVSCSWGDWKAGGGGWGQGNVNPLVGQCGYPLECLEATQA